MATTFNGSVYVQILGAMVKALDIGTASLDINYAKRHKIVNGNLDAQANMIWSDTRTIAPSTIEDLDLYGGLTNAFGDTINFTAVKGIFIFANADNVNNLLVGGDANALVNYVGNNSDVLVIKPGGLFCVYDPTSGGYGVTNTTGDILQVANSSSGSSVVYDIIIVGEV